ncbi:MAG: sugar phosphate isomerase/epimerase [Lachnospiraceae bacterium]|nr:sugar phosphate isomerase/epimerase [Lachnospiraceae bacterium]
MKLGISNPASKIEASAKAGFDYLELPLNQLDVSPEALAALKARLSNAGIVLESFNCFFPGTLSLYGETDPILAYAERQLNGAAALGAKLCVVGSGAARKIPEGMEKAAAEERFLCLLGKIGDLARAREIRLAIEPLNYGETNFINTVAEGRELCRKLAHPSVGCLIDFYHFWKNGESLADLDNFRPGELFHVHLARPNNDRGYPKAEDRDALASWASKLKAIGYDDRLTLECRFSDGFEEHAAEALSELQVFRG